MASATLGIADAATLTPSEVSEIWLGHLMSFCIPLTALVYVWTGPHTWYTAPLLVVPLAIFHWADTRPLIERRQPLDSLPAWPFDLLVYALTAIHFLILYKMAVLFTAQSVFSVDMLMIFVVVGGNSGFSIITAHELIHRKTGWEQLLGRLLLCTVMYEHFYTEHLRGHHVRVGTPEDPATARFGESYRAFWRRTVPAQFKSAWRLEAKRLGDEEMHLFDARMLGNRIVHGLIAESALAFAILYFFGGVAFGAYLLQAFVAVRALEAVNYFEHWGLRRMGRRVRPLDSWDTHSWFTYYGLIGLSRHADHHANPSRPYQQLRVWDQAPVLPVGYVALVDMVIGRNDDFRKLASAELERRRLGPFADDPPPFPEPEVDRGPATWIARQFTRLPSALRPVVGLAIVLCLVSLGMAFEAGPSMSWVDALLYNGAIVAILGAILTARFWIQKQVQNNWISWGIALVLIPIVGTLVTPWLS
ncbi:MAG: fatty acid desaturase [Deltaproteobacteria bacterium]|nr:fatty acid desaturase [Deltaproteobacteria bacterium]